MPKATLDTILDEVRALAPEEQRELGRRLQEILHRGEALKKMDDFHRDLLASGLVKEIKDPPVDTGGGRRLVEIKGKPLSETILEDRR
jgi:hypothetical protein